MSETISHAQPKGGMCTTCTHKARDCSTLPFCEMPVLVTTDDGTMIVRCTDFQRAPPPIWCPP